MENNNKVEESKLLKKYLFRAKLINGILLAFLLMVSILSFFEKTTFAAFIICCIVSVVWTIVYRLFAHDMLYKINSKFVWLFIIFAAIICGVSYLSFYAYPKAQFDVEIGETGITWKLIIPVIIAIKFLSDIWSAFVKSRQRYN